MKTHPALSALVLLPLLACARVRAQEASLPLADWRQVQPLTPAATGLVRFAIPSSTHGAAQGDLRDLRLISPSGVETPYLLQWPQQDTVASRPVTGFHARIEGDKTVLEMSTPTQDPIRALTLDAATPSFLKAVKLEGTQDGTNWQPLGEPGIVFRQKDGSSRMRLPVAPGSWKQLRATLDDSRTAPAAFTGASVELLRSASTTVKEAVTVEQVEQVNGRTRLHLALQTPHAWLGALHLQTPDPVFSRKVTLQAEPPSPGNPGPVLASATVFRLQVDDLNASSLDIPVHQQALGDKLVLEIENGSSPPLKIEGIEATRYPVHLLFSSQEAGEWRLYSGNPLAIAPYYDLSALSPRLHGAQTDTAALGELQGNPGYRKDGVLGQFAESGSAIDTSGWRRRKRVIIKQPGVQRLELDLEASCHHHVRDLRLVQDGRQLPYLLLPDGIVRTVDLPATPDPDPKRPTWSRWKVALPHAGPPFQRLEIQTPSRVFERTLFLMEERKNPSGRTERYQTALGSVVVRNAEGPQDVKLAVDTAITGREVWLEADNGDNTPMGITRVQGEYIPVRLKFQVTSGSPLYLYYDHPSIPAPRYDLRLVERELNLAEPAVALLAVEEPLAPGKSAEEAKGEGSVLLWLALAAVAGGLLWVVVKLLPEQPGGGSPSAS